jgi:thiamine kinase-like enzyme
MAIKEEIDSLIGAKKVPCHNDPLCENWVVGNGRMYLIDWEYAGMNDGMWDVADVSIEAGFGEKEDEALLQAYLERKPEASDRLHFLASKIYVDDLWTLWAKARVPYDGQPMEDWATERYARMKDNLEQYAFLKEERK